MGNLHIIYDPTGMLEGCSTTTKSIGVRVAILPISYSDPIDIYEVARKLAEMLLEQLVGEVI